MMVDDLFPKVEMYRHPGKSSNYIVQLRRPKKITEGGIIVVDEAREAESDNTTIGKVVALGDGCFRFATTGKPWPEGAWFEIGDYLQVPRYGGMRFRVKHDDDYIHFVIFDHLQFIARVTGDPRKIIDYI
jgi:co-chaperonin GroES (HSP10)